MFLWVCKIVVVFYILYVFFGEKFVVFYKVDDLDIVQFNIFIEYLIIIRLFLYNYE